MTLVHSTVEGRVGRRRKETQQGIVWPPHAQCSSPIQEKLVLVKYTLTVPGSSEQPDDRQDAISIATRKTSSVVKMTDVACQRQAK